MSWSITFEIYGENFKPENLDNKIKDMLRIKSGYAQYLCDDDMNPESGINEIHDQFASFIPDLVNAGAETWIINIGRFYKDQCNEELSLESMKKMVNLQCGFTYSAYEDE